MRTRTLLIVLVLLLVVAFLAINWSVFAASIKVSLLFTSADVPIGLVMLGMLTLIALPFGIYSAVSWSSILLEFRRQAKELTAQRTLADQAEASRFTELRTLMHDELEQSGRSNRAAARDPPHRDSRELELACGDDR